MILVKASNKQRTTDNDLRSDSSGCFIEGMYQGQWEKRWGDE